MTAKWLKLLQAFKNATHEHISQSAILYDKFHVIHYLNEAIDKVRKEEYVWLSGEECSFIKWQKYNLLSCKEQLELPAKTSLKLLLLKNK